MGLQLSASSKIKEAKEAAVISEAMALLGSRKTEAKSAAARRNGVATRFKAKPLSEFQCTCGKCPDTPRTYCPRGRAFRRRQSQAETTAAD